MCDREPSLSRESVSRALHNEELFVTLNEACSSSIEGSGFVRDRPIDHTAGRWTQDERNRIRED